MFKDRDGVLGMLPLSVALVFLLTASFTQFMGDAELGADMAGASAFITLSGHTLFASLIVAGRRLPIPVRLQEYERALPITMRRVVLQRVGALWLLVFATYLAGALVWLGSHVTSADIGVFGLLVARGFFASGIMCTLLAAYRPSRAVLSGVEAAVVALASGLAWLAPSWLLSDVGLVPYACVLGLLLAWLWFAIPAAASPDSAVARASDPDEGQPFGFGSLGPGFISPLNWVILRSSLLRPQVAFIAMMAVVYMFLPDMFGSFRLLFVVMLPFLGMRLGLNLLHGIDGMPLKRERVLRVTGLPILAFLMLVLALETRVERTYFGFVALSNAVAVDACSEDTLAGEGEHQTHVKVPPSVWRITEDPGSAVATSPWGETASPALHPLYKGASSFAYNPFDVGRDNSLKFLAWQVGRALDAVHGPGASASVDYVEWSARLTGETTIGKASRLAMSTKDWDLGPEHSAPLSTPLAGRLGFAALGGMLIWILVTGYVLLPNVPRLRVPAWLSVFPPGAGGFVLVTVVALLLMEFHSADRILMPVMGAAAEKWLDARLASSPLGWAALLVALGGAAYVVFARRIQRIEVPPIAVHGWTKKPMSIY